MISFNKFVQIINEGGNVFEGSTKIKKEYIKPTLNSFFNEFKSIFPKAGIHFENIRILGSAGKKDYSGDIDLALSETSFDNIEDWEIDENRVKELFAGFKKRAKTSSDKQLLKRSVIVAIAEKIKEESDEIIIDIKGSSTGALFCQYPQYNENNEKTSQYVQIDINVGDVDWLSFAYHSATYKGNVKGLHRTQLLVSLFAYKGYIFSHNYGVKDRETHEIAASTPSQAINLLNDLYNLDLDMNTVGDYFSLIAVLKNRLSEEDLNGVLDTFLKILDKTRTDIPEDLQNYWVSNQLRLDLTGKFLPDDSNLIKYKV